MFFPKVWDLIEGFKIHCDRKGWKLCGNEDIVDTGREYHYFVWTRHIYPSTFKKVVMNPYFPVREGTSYKMVNVSFIAWISPVSISEKVLEIFLETPGLSRKAAIYDTSPLYKGEPMCLRMNETNSIVFQEFERFLTEKYRITFKSLSKPRTAISSV